MKKVKKPELLAPAGDLERLKIAFLYGADAVYIGGQIFGLRANATNFTIEEMQEGITFAHNLQKKVYVTVNIALHNKEIKQLIQYLKQLEEIKVDAIIVSDPAVIQIAKENTNLELHLSTQQSALNYEAIEFFKQLGVKRIVLGREATKKEIEEIIEKVDIEIECFIHGAMCASYSGRCVLSNFLTNRDANRGGCSQICRWDFKLMDENNNPVQGEKDFTFCSKDLSMLKYIPEMIRMNIASFKIEGRMRSVYYIATVVDTYRKAIDRYCDQPDTYEYNKEDEQILRNCANRDSVPQFFEGTYDSKASYYNGREEISNQDFLGLVLEYNEKEKYAIIEQRNYFKKKDKVVFFGPHKSNIEFTIDEIEDLDGNPIEVVRHPKQIVKIKIPNRLQPNDMMRIKRN